MIQQSEENWNECYEKLLTYQDWHGTYNVVTGILVRLTSGKEYDLGKWLSYQRRMWILLSANRQAKLNKLKLTSQLWETTATKSIIELKQLVEVEPSVEMDVVPEQPSRDDSLIQQLHNNEEAPYISHPLKVSVSKAGFLQVQASNIVDLQEQLPLVKPVERKKSPVFPRPVKLNLRSRVVPQEKLQSMIAFAYYPFMNAKREDIEIGFGQVTYYSNNNTMHLDYLMLPEVENCDFDETRYYQDEEYVEEDDQVYIYKDAVLLFNVMFQKHREEKGVRASYSLHSNSVAALIECIEYKAIQYFKHKALFPSKKLLM